MADLEISALRSAAASRSLAALSSLCGHPRACLIGIELLLRDFRLFHQRLHARQIRLGAVVIGLPRVHVGAGHGQFCRGVLFVNCLGSIIFSLRSLAS